jgi:hypothetical protein
MLSVGKSVYDACETLSKHEQFDCLVACPFQANGAKPREQWCRACLLAKIGSLTDELWAIAKRAEDASTSRY